jgi:hypothetical protein
MKIAHHFSPALLTTIFVPVLGIFLLSGCTASPKQSSSTVAFFEVGFHGKQKPFVIRLDETNKIIHARRILSREEKGKTHISGMISKGTTCYNPRWRLSLDPSSIQFFELAIEVCDAAPDFIEDNLDDPDSLFPPGHHWCPWASHLVREVQPNCP